MTERRERALATALGAARARDVAASRLDGAQHLEAVARAQRVEKVPRLHAGAQDDVDEENPRATETSASMRTRSSGRTSLGVAVGEAQPDEAEESR